MAKVSLFTSEKRKYFFVRKDNAPLQFTESELGARLALFCQKAQINPDQIEIMVPVHSDILHQAVSKANDLMGIQVMDGVLLTPREREVLKEVNKGASNKEIAYILHITERTVKFHVQSLMMKFGVPSRTRLPLETPNADEKVAV